MAITVTMTSGPIVLGEGMKLALYEITLDNSYPTGGEAVNLTTAANGSFTYCKFAQVGGNDADADNGYKFGVETPGASTALTSSNFLITGHWQTDPADAGGANIPLTEVDNTTDLSSVGKLQLMVIGV